MPNTAAKNTQASFVPANGTNSKKRSSVIRIKKEEIIQADVKGSHPVGTTQQEERNLSNSPEHIGSSSSQSRQIYSDLPVPTFFQGKSKSSPERSAIEPASIIEGR